MNKPAKNPPQAPLPIPAELWVRALKLLEERLNRDLFKLWFEPIRCIAVEPDTITLGVVNDFSIIWLKDNYLGLLSDAINHAAGRNFNIQFAVSAEAKTPAVPVEIPAAQSAEPKARSSRPSDAGLGSTKDLVFNPKNTFESFVVGSNNQFAHAAAMAVAASPGKAYNPLFIYGGTGLGKTHLLHSVGQHVLEHKKAAKVSYVSCEKFTNEFIDAIQNNQLVKFRRRYRSSDVLLIDDIQFLSGKERIQEEFFHTFNDIHTNHRQLVLTSDRPIAEMKDIEQRLVSRFEWGVVTDLQPPDVETRLAILRKKEATTNIKLPDEILNMIATRIRTNVRRLEGALIRLTSFASLTGRALTLAKAEELLHDMLSEEGRPAMSIEVIQKRVAEHFDIRLADMTSKRRPEHIAFPRQIAMFLARTLTPSSLSTIGEAFGGRDHGTVLHACRLVKDRMDVDTGVKQVVGFLERQLQR